MTTGRADARRIVLTLLLATVIAAAPMLSFPAPPSSGQGGTRPVPPPAVPPASVASVVYTSAEANSSPTTTPAIDFAITGTVVVSVCESTGSSYLPNSVTDSAFNAYSLSASYKDTSGLDAIWCATYVTGTGATPSSSLAVTVTWPASASFTNPAAIFIVGIARTYSVGSGATADSNTAAAAVHASVAPGTPPSGGVTLDLFFVGASGNGGASVLTTWWHPSGGGQVYYVGSQNSSGGLNAAPAFDVFLTTGASGTDSITENVTTSERNWIALLLPLTLIPHVAASFTASAGPYIAGSAVTFTSAVSGGTGTYTYSWKVGGNQVGTSADLTYTFSPAGSYVVNLTATDTISDVGWAQQTVGVLLDVGASPSANPTDVGYATTFTSTVSGGASTPYSYTWKLNGTQTSTASDWTYTFTKGAPAYVVDLTVEDNSGNFGWAQLTEAVDASLAISATSNVSAADVNIPIAFSVSVTSPGAGGYTYSWTLGATVLSTAASFSHAFATAAPYTVYVNVTDSSGNRVTATVPVTVNPLPTASVSSSSNPADTSYAVTFTANAAHGTGTLTYSWQVNGVAEGTASTLGYTFGAGGSYSIAVNVTDADHQRVMSVLTEVVGGSGPSASLSASENPTDPGISVEFTSTASAGVTPYTFSWTVAGTVQGDTGRDLNYTFPASGSYSVVVTVTDADGRQATATVGETVNSAVSVAVASSQNPTDVGNSVTYTATASQGTSPYVSYTWTDAGTSVCSSSSTCALTMSSSGSIAISVTVTDTAGGTGTGSLTETVHADLSVTVTASLNPVDAGASVTYTAAASGGTTPYTSYAWTENGAAVCISSTTCALTMSSSGTFTIAVTVTDTPGGTASNSLSETVNPALSVSVSPSKNPADVGMSVTYTADVSGGTTPYTSYAWTEAGGSVCSSSSTCTLTMSSAGSIAIAVTVTDTATAAKSGSVTETVNADPSVTVASSQNPADVGASVTYTASATGGTTPYTSYAWTEAGVSVCTSSATCTLTMSSAGSIAIAVTVTDTAGGTGTGSLTETVHADLSVTVTSSENPADAGASVTYTSAASGGTTPYVSYAWTEAGSSVCGSTSTCSLTMSTSGSFAIDVTVTDSATGTATGSLTETVNLALSVSASSSRNPTDAGASVTYSASASGGTTPYTSYAWTEAGVSVCTSSATCTLTMSSSGSVTVAVLVTDSAASTKSASLTETVNNDPAVSVSSSQNPTDAGASVTYTATASGGTTPYTSYAWTEAGVAVCGSTSTCSLTMSASGSFAIGVTVTDAATGTAAGTLTETVHADPTVSVTASVNPADAGMPVTFTAVPSGGTSPFSYAWTINGAAQGSTTAQLSYSFSSPGTFRVNVTATDTVGYVATYSFTETVHADPAASATSSMNPSDAGMSVTFSATVTGGTSPFTYAWTVNSAPSGTSSTLVYAFSASGTYTVSVTVTDTDGQTSTATVSQVVNADLTVSLSARYSPVDANVSDLFTATTTGGSGTITFAWTVNGATIPGASSTATYSAILPGSYTVQVQATDALGQRQSASLSLTVTADPSVSATGPRVTEATIGSSWTGAGAHGSTPYTYSWTINGATEGVSTTLSYTFGTAGDYTLNLTLTDADGATAYWQETVQVRLYVSESANVTSGLTPLPVQLEGSAIGGSGYTYNWSANGTRLSTVQSPPWTFAAGVWDVELTVTDSSGFQGFANITITVSPGGLPTVVVTGVETPIVPDTLLSLSASGSSSPDSHIAYYNWTLSGLALTGPVQYLWFNATGSFALSLTITDARGASAAASWTINVTTPGNYSGIILSLTSTSSGSSTTYVLHVSSPSGISAADAFLQGQLLSLTLDNSTVSGGLTVEANYTLAVNGGTYSPGSYALSFVAWNPGGESNSTALQFTVSGGGIAGGFPDLVSLVGGPVNFWFIVSGIIGAIGTVVGLTRRDTVDVDIGGARFTGKKGKPLVYTGVLPAKRKK